MFSQLKSILPYRQRITTGVSPTELIKLADEKGFNVIQGKDGQIDFIPKDFDTNVDIRTLTEQWHSLSNVEPAVAQNREVRFRSYDRMDSQGGEGVIILDSYADEVLYSSSDNKEDIKIKISDTSYMDDIMKCLRMNGVLDSVREDVRSIAKYGDLAYCILPRRGVNLLRVPEDDALQYTQLTNIKLRPEDLVIRAVPSPQYDLVGLSNKILQLNLKEESIQYRQLYEADEFKPWEFVLFSIRSRDTFPYGMSKLEPMRVPWENMTIVEQLLAITRANRVDKIAVSVPVGQSDPLSAVRKLGQLRNSIKSVLMGQNVPGGMTTSRVTRNQSQPMTEWFFVPEDFKVERLSTQLDIGSIQDVEYFRDKVINTSRIPKAYFLADGTDTRTGSLRQQDLRFARTVQPIEEAYRRGLEDLIFLIAFYLGADISKFSVEVTLNRPPYVSKDLLETYSDVLDSFGKFVELKQLVEPDYKPTDSDVKQMLDTMGLPTTLLFRESEAASRTPNVANQKQVQYDSLMEAIMGKQSSADLKSNLVNGNSQTNLGGLISESVLDKDYDNMKKRMGLK